MIQVNILSRSAKFSFGHKIGFWHFFSKYKKELENHGIRVSFFNQINDYFLRGDKLILNSKFFSSKSSNRLSSIKKIYKKNHNLIWYDMRDSSGNTQFDVLPYVKFYLKKQFLKNKELYNQTYLNNRIYCEYYKNNFKEQNSNSFSEPNIKLNINYIDKLILGWNIGIKRFFDFSEHSSINFFLSKYGIVNYKNYLLNFNKDYFNRQNLISCEFGSHPKQQIIRSNIMFQRELLLKNLEKIGYEGFLIKIKNKKKYYKKLKNSKLVIGAFGLGEICERDFEATLLGASFTTGNMNHLETWPNIYQPNYTYLPYDWNLKNLKNIIERIAYEKGLYEKLIKNSQKVLAEAYSDEGKIYFLNLCKKIFL